LNGVSVNLEVIRSRSGKPNATVSAVGPFADAASDQLDSVIALTEALLGLTRPAREPVDVAVEARRIVILLGAVARADGRQLTIDDAGFEGLGVTSAPGSVVRLAICECLLTAVDASTQVNCTAIAGSQGQTIHVETGEGHAMAVDAELVVAAAEGGIHIQAERSAISISFPR
jgi:hypothetical protein